MYMLWATWCGCWDLNSSPLQEQYVFLHPEPSPTILFLITHKPYRVWARAGLRIGLASEVLYVNMGSNHWDPRMVAASSSGIVPVFAHLCLLRPEYKVLSFVSKSMARPRLGVLVSEALYQIMPLLPLPVPLVLGIKPRASHMVSKYYTIDSYPHSWCLLFCLSSACASSELGAHSLVWELSYSACANASVLLSISTLGRLHLSLHLSLPVVYLWLCSWPLFSDLPCMTHPDCQN